MYALDWAKKVVKVVELRLASSFVEYGNERKSADAQFHGIVDLFANDVCNREIRI